MQETNHVEGVFHRVETNQAHRLDIVVLDAAVRVVTLALFRYGHTRHPEVDGLAINLFHYVVLRPAVRLHEEKVVLRFRL